VALENVIDLDYQDGLQRLNSLNQQSLYVPMDGAFLNTLSRFEVGEAHIYQLLLQHAALRAATRLMIGLNGFRRVHAHYPKELSELAPEFVDVLPLDPFCDGPFGYRSDEQGEYVLYSCGPDGDDDGGQDRRSPTGESQPWWQADDMIFTQPRPAAYVVEPVAVPLETPARSGSD
jgi:hypothetical protein